MTIEAIRISTSPNVFLHFIAERKQPTPTTVSTAASRRTAAFASSTVNLGSTSPPMRTPSATNAPLISRSSVIATAISTSKTVRIFGEDIIADFVHHSQFARAQRCGGVTTSNKKRPARFARGPFVNVIFARFLVHRPRISALEQCLQIALPLLGLRLFELLVYRAVIRRPRDRVEHSDRGRQRRLEVAEHERERKIGLVVHDQVFL